MVFYYFVSAHGGRRVNLTNEFTRVDHGCEVGLAMPHVDPDDIEVRYRDHQVFIAAKLMLGNRTEDGRFYAAMTIPKHCSRENLVVNFDGEVLRIALHRKATPPVLKMAVSS